jgi:hypothetical protein
VLCIRVKREQVTLSVWGGATVAAWTQPEHHREHVEVVRSHDGAVALVAVGNRVTVVRLSDGEIVRESDRAHGVARRIRPPHPVWRVMCR